MKLLFPTTNPFINLIQLLTTNNIELNNSITQIFYSFLESDIVKNNDINESFFTISDSRNISSQNIFYSLSLLKIRLSQIEYQQFFDRLFDAGLKIQPQINIDLSNQDNFNQPLTKEILQLHINQSTNNIIHSVFDYMSLSEDRNIYFLTHLLKTIPFHDYLTNIQTASSYHKAVLFNKHKLIEFFHNSNIPVDILDQDLNTPLMFCKNLNIVKLINSFNPNWFLTNINNEDATTCFIHIANPEERISVLDYAQNIINNSHNTYIIDDKKAYIKERNRHNLMKLVLSDKPKKELQDFIKKNKPENIGTIIDNEGNNLLMISLKNNNWARAKLFLSECDINHLNNKNQCVTTLLLQKTDIYITRIRDAYAFLHYSLDHKDFQQSKESLFLSLLETQLLTNEQPLMPTLLVKDPKFLLKLNFTQQELTDIVKKYNALFPHYRYSNIKNDEIQGFSFIVDFFLTGFQHENKPFYLNFEQLIDSLFSKKRIEENKLSMNFSFKNNSMNQYLILLDRLDFFNIDYDKDTIKNILFNSILSFLLDGFNNHKSYYCSATTIEEEKKYNQIQFISSSEHVLKILIQAEKFDIINQLPKDFLFYDKFSKDTQTGLRYAILQKTMQPKTIELETTECILRKKI
jgi:hypothetical protein